jgi:DNA-binding MarR family transcriptional regulator
MKHTNYTKTKTLLNTFRELHADFPMPLALVFLEACQSGNEGLTITQVEKRVGISQSAASRHTRMLTKEGCRGREGYDLCDWHYDLNDRRIRLLKLNSKGLALSKRIEEALV